jgi:hypothetical protein
MLSVIPVNMKSLILRFKSVCLFRSLRKSIHLAVQSCLSIPVIQEVHPSCGSKLSFIPVTQEVHPSCGSKLSVYSGHSGSPSICGSKLSFIPVTQGA